MLPPVAIPIESFLAALIKIASDAVDVVVIF